MKKITGQIKLQIPAGKANPAPPVGPALGQHGVNIMEFCKQFNAATQAQAKEALIIPVIITVYQDRSFTLHPQDARRRRSCSRRRPDCTPRRRRAPARTSPARRRSGR